MIRIIRELSITHPKGVLGSGASVLSISLATIAEFIQNTVLIFIALIIAIITGIYWVKAIKSKNKESILQDLQIEEERMKIARLKLDNLKK